MEVITIESQAYFEIIRKIDELGGRLNNGMDTVKDLIIDNPQFLKLMGISKRTAQAWRDEGIISFSQINGKIYYKQSDIDEMLQLHRKPAFKGRKN